MDCRAKLDEERFGERDPEIKQSKKGPQWYFGMKANIGLDARSGLFHTVRGTAGNVNDVVKANASLHGHERELFVDAGYQGAATRHSARAGGNGTLRCARVSAEGSTLSADIDDALKRSSG